MMGKQEAQAVLFVPGFDLGSRVRTDHPLRRVEAAVDFSFVRPLVAPLYGYNGNVSVDPEVVLKLMFLNHRAVDDAFGVITATQTTPGDVNENAQMPSLRRLRASCPVHAGRDPDVPGGRATGVFGSSGPVLTLRARWGAPGGRRTPS
jgi:hypothetical protein